MLRRLADSNTHEVRGGQWRTARVLESLGLAEKVHGSMMVILGYRITAWGRDEVQKHRHRNA
jgi:hypothetical protein